MQIIYYHNLDLNIVPVKKFLLKYDLKSSDNAKTKNRKIKILAFIDQTIKFIAENKGQPVLPIAKPLRNYKFHEMRVKTGSNLIRILYFCYLQKKLVLLNAFEKPVLYEKKRKKKIEREISKILDQTNNYYKDFIKNQNYEKYN